MALPLRGMPQRGKGCTEVQAGMTLYAKLTAERQHSAGRFLGSLSLGFMKLCDSYRHIPPLEMTGRVSETKSGFRNAAFILIAAKRQSTTL